MLLHSSLPPAPAPSPTTRRCCRCCGIWLDLSTATSTSWPATPLTPPRPHCLVSDLSTTTSSGVTPRRSPWSSTPSMPHAAVDPAARAVDAPIACRHRRRRDRILQHVAGNAMHPAAQCSPPPSKPGLDSAGRTHPRTIEPRSSPLPPSTPAPDLAFR
ncbi:hypothetical protein DAI22_04g027300 [Oryza sativa Japonica Group]|nr:hypothetical protein DAI22_04g027300 [Oryza sativa Japonica Group]